MPSKSEIKRLEAQGAEPQVVDKRRFNGPVGPDDGSDLPRAGSGEGPWEMIARGEVDTKPDLLKEQQETYDTLFTEPRVLATAEFETCEFSPSSDPNKPIGMDCASALKQAREGKRVTRIEWGNPEEYLMMFMWGAINPKTPAGKYLTIHHADGAMHPLYISDGDLSGDDWVVVS